MQRVMLKSKIHRATITGCDLHYVGSITIDPDLLSAADILDHEQVHVLDIDNGARFETYTIAGEPGSGVMQINGAAARLVHRGDTIIVVSYAHYDQAELQAMSLAWCTSRPTPTASSPSTTRWRPCSPRSPSPSGWDRPSRRRGVNRRQRGPQCQAAPPSTPPSTCPSDPGRLPMTLPLLAEKKRLGDPIVMVTAYDYPSARAAQAAGVDLVLVGDSAATTVLGYNATTPVRLEDMLVLAAAARRGLTTPLLVGDLPFGSYEISDEQAVAAAIRMVQQAGCDAVKLEGGGEAPASRARAIVNAGIPVMGHVGLTPQTSTALGGWKAQGRTAAAAARIASEALALQRVGCFALVFEAIPAAVTEELMQRVEIPVIGIGAGPATDGQVLVFHDLLGIRDGLGPRFVKRYANLQQEMNAGVAAYAQDVRARRYPGPEHTYSIDPGELAELREQLA